MVFKNSKWIKVKDYCEAPLIRKEFYVKDIIRANINICGLGFFELYINGNKVSEDVLTPVWSDYEKRENRELAYPIHDKFTHRIYYLEYEITNYLVERTNTIGVILGNGWYNQYRRNCEGNLWYGKPKLTFKIEMEHKDGTLDWVVSDENLKWAESEIISNNIYYGEKQDLRLIKKGWNVSGYNDNDWQYVEVLDSPSSHLTKQTCPSDRVIRRLKPKLLRQVGESKIYDVGENISGWVRLKSEGKMGESIKVKHAEECNEDMTLNFNSTGGIAQIQEDEYITDGNEYILEPKFTYHGFRYFQVTGNAEPIECVVVHSDVKVISSFESDNEILNWLYEAYIRTQLTNMHCGVPSDCPHRERLGYTGDGQLTCDTAMLLLDSQKFYEKWIRDIADSQDIEGGHIQHTAPFYGGGGGPGGWGSAIVIVPYYYYKHFGDIEILREYYPHMIKWLKYMQSRSEDGLIIREEEGGWCLGEWVTPESIKIPESYINTYYYIKSMILVKEILNELNIREYMNELERCITYSKQAMINKYYNIETASFCEGIQGADAFAIDIEIGNERTLERLVTRYRKSKAFDTGIFGTDILISVLFQKGYAQEAFDLLTSQSDISFYHQKQLGATTFWENWNGQESHNHPMFGAVVKNLFYYLLGIHYRADKQELEIIPEIVQGLNNVKGYVQLKQGLIQVAYSIKENQIIFNIVNEVNSNAYLIFGDKRYKLSKGENKLLEHLK